MKEHEGMPFDTISVQIVFLTIFNHLSLSGKAKLSMASCVKIGPIASHWLAIDPIKPHAQKYLHPSFVPIEYESQT